MLRTPPTLMACAVPDAEKALTQSVATHPPHQPSRRAGQACPPCFTLHDAEVWRARCPVQSPRGGRQWEFQLQL